jgi:hypothetical protein
MDEMQQRLVVAEWIQEALAVLTRGVIFYAVPLTLYWTIVE